MATMQQETQRSNPQTVRTVSQSTSSYDQELAARAEQKRREERARQRVLEEQAHRVRERLERDRELSTNAKASLERERSTFDSLQSNPKDSPLALADTILLLRRMMTNSESVKNKFQRDQHSIDTALVREFQDFQIDLNRQIAALTDTRNKLLHNDFRRYYEKHWGSWPPLESIDPMREFLRHEQHPHPDYEFEKSFENLYPESGVDRAPSSLARLETFANGLAKLKFGGLKVHRTLSDIPPAFQERVTSLKKLLARTRGDFDPHAGAIQVHKDEGSGVTYVSFGSSKHGGYTISIPRLFEKSGLIRLLKAIARGIGIAFGKSDPFTVINGDCQDLNFNDVLPDRIVYRTRSHRISGVDEKLRYLNTRNPLSKRNTQIVNGLPANSTQLNRLFPGTDDWDVWEPATLGWVEEAKQSGLELQSDQVPDASAFTKALTTKENVIVLVAHGDSKHLHFPDPAPIGSRVGVKELEALKEEITRNGPVVYLFCCETAKIEDFSNITQALLDNGVRSVVSPQTTLNAVRSLELFSNFVELAQLHSPEAALRDAQNKTKNRKMERWIG